MHAATLWQIALAADTAYASPVANIFTTVFLTTIPVISGLLPSTDYRARARYFDDEGTSSAFGPSVLFTTLAANTIPEPGTFAGATQGCGDC